MLNFFSLMVLALLIVSCSSKSDSKKVTTENMSCDGPKYRIVIHAGVGYTANPEQFAAMKRILIAAGEKLKAKAPSLDVVQFAVEQMEDTGIFNAGKGGVRTSKNTVELDASMMDGRDLSAGAVASVKDVKNPIRLARMVKDKTKHVFMVGEGASAYAREQKLEIVKPNYFTASVSSSHDRSHYGTVGAAAYDRCGNLAAATSTGGLMGKLPGRVGDSPVIGGGTYANNKTCAISATGEGEKFIRATVASRISSIIQYTDRNLNSAMSEALDLVVELGGSGGIIGLDKNGNIVTQTSNDLPMPRGHITEEHSVSVTN